MTCTVCVCRVCVTRVHQEIKVFDPSKGWRMDEDPQVLHDTLCIDQKQGPYMQILNSFYVDIIRTNGSFSKRKHCN